MDMVREKPTECYDFYRDIIQSLIHTVLIRRRKFKKIKNLLRLQ